ncbi:Hypp3485 [Branchiostoma lanceolatum]|uniref:Hypp3485 protein n=1 Tax=Branchiostoma lanceolatum TaxID=7740 RepID=A0A8K0A162_BRALA|nr:Hypp3485 [Branchiostoma lanceolatum]
MTLRVPLPDHNRLTLISVYAPTLDSEDDVNESPAKRSRRFDVARLKIPEVREDYANRLTELQSETPPPAQQPDSVEADWSVFRDNISKAREDAVGYCRRSHQD